MTVGGSSITILKKNAGNEIIGEKSQQTYSLLGHYNEQRKLLMAAISSI